jgi:hypothetical protein
MKNRENTKRVNKYLKKKPPIDISETKRFEKFSMQIGTEPYSLLGIGERCKAKGCGQPVYDGKLGLCSYHRMNKAQKAFEDNRLRARQQLAGGEG